MDIRVLRPSDIPHVQLANITNLPENYFCKYYLYHAMSWPQLSYVAVDVSGIGVLCVSMVSFFSPLLKQMVLEEMGYWLFYKMNFSARDGYSWV